MKCFQVLLLFVIIAESQKCELFLIVEECVGITQCAWCTIESLCINRKDKDVFCADYWCGAPVITNLPQEGSGMMNQRLSMLSTLALADSAHRPYVLPSIRLRHIVTKNFWTDNSTVVPFEKIYDASFIQQILAAAGICVLRYIPRQFEEFRKDATKWATLVHDEHAPRAENIHPTLLWMRTYHGLDAYDSLPDKQPQASPLVLTLPNGYLFCWLASSHHRIVARIANDALYLNQEMQHIAEFASSSLRRIHSQWSVSLNATACIRQEDAHPHCIINGLHWRVEEDLGGNPNGTLISQALAEANIPRGSVVYIGWFLRNIDMLKEENKKFVDAVSELCLNAHRRIGIYYCIFQDDLTASQPKLSAWHRTMTQDERAYIDYHLFSSVVDRFISTNAGSSFTSFVAWWRLRHQTATVFLVDSPAGVEPRRLRVSDDYPASSLFAIGIHGDIRSAL